MNQIAERIREFNQGRDPEMLQLKYQLMQNDVFAFFRGTCHLFYQDWPQLSPLNEAAATWICGDLHLQNLGCYKGDNRLVYFNINDFDEAVLAPYTWDLARFLTSLLLAAPDLNIDKATALTLCEYTLNAYEKAIRKAHIQSVDDNNVIGPAKELLFQVKKRPRAVFLDTYTRLNGQTRSLLIDGKHTHPVTETERAEVTAALEKWGEKQHNPTFFKVLDIAHRIAGIGSLGVERYVLLVEGKGSPDQNYLLDLKAEAASSLQPYLQMKQPAWHDQGERCVEIQKWVQGIAPALLTIIEMNEQSYILREMQPLEDKINLSLITGKQTRLEQLLKVLAKVIAWGQLRSSGRHGAADAHTLIDSVQKPGWQKELIHYAQAYAQHAREDYTEFATAYKDGELRVS